MSSRFDVLRACEPLITAALDMALAERRLPSGSAVAKYTERTADLVQQVRAVHELLEDLEPGEMPKSWRRQEREAS